MCGHAEAPDMRSTDQILFLAVILSQNDEIIKHIHQIFFFHDATVKGIFFVNFTLNIC